VAIKTIGAGKARADAQRLLVREAAAAAQLRHPHVVELLDFVVANGRPYLVLELVDGHDVERWLDVWPGWPVVADAVDQVLDALSTAHAAGILHRDLKPANLLYSRTGAIKITDFGMAELVDPLAPSDVGPFGGTPLYMAPEQLDPFGHQGPWTDLYALGVILYLLLTGREPVVLDEANWKQAKKSPPRRFRTRSGLSNPPELERLILAMVDPDPNRRPRFAADVRAELRSLRDRAHEGAIVIPVDAPS
jgi:serine/threonine protein kinase